MPKNLPFVSVGASVALAVVAVTLVLTGQGDDGGGGRLLDAIVTAIPVLLTAGAYSERNSKDIRNGTVTEKARVGTHQALDESGVKAAVEASPPEATAAAYQALVRLLERDHVERVDVERAAVPVVEAAEHTAEQLP